MTKWERLVQSLERIHDMLNDAENSDQGMDLLETIRLIKKHSWRMEYEERYDEQQRSLS